MTKLWILLVQQYKSLLLFSPLLQTRGSSIPPPIPPGKKKQHKTKPWSRPPHSHSIHHQKILGSVLGLCLESWKGKRSDGEMDTQDKRRAYPRGSQIYPLPFFARPLSHKKHLHIGKIIFKSLEESQMKNSLRYMKIRWKSNFSVHK